MVAVADSPSFEVVPPDDEVIDDSLLDVQTFACGACDAVFDSARGLNVHVGHLHPGQDDLKRSTKKTRSDVPPGEVDKAKRNARATRVDRSKRGQTAAIKRSILEDINPFMVRTSVRFGVPEAMLTTSLSGMGFDKPLKEEIGFSETEAAIVARGLVEINGTPAAAAFVRTVGPLVPYAFGLAAVGVVLLHGLKLFALRKQLVTLNAQVNGSENGSPVHLV